MDKSFKEVLNKWKNKDISKLEEKDYKNILEIASRLDMQEKFLYKLFSVPKISVSLFLGKNNKYKRYTIK